MTPTRIWHAADRPDRGMSRNQKSGCTGPKNKQIHAWAKRLLANNVRQSVTKLPAPPRRKGDETSAVLPCGQPSRVSAVKHGPALLYPLLQPDRSFSERSSRRPAHKSESHRQVQKISLPKDSGLGHHFGNSAPGQRSGYRAAHHEVKANLLKDDRTLRTAGQFTARIHRLERRSPTRTYQDDLSQPPMRVTGISLRGTPRRR